MKPEDSKKQNNTKNQRNQKNRNNQANQGFDWNAMIDFCRRNMKYIAVGIVILILIIVLAVVSTRKDGGSKEEPDQVGELTQNERGDQEEFQVDAIPEINTLIQNYYTAYAAGDVAGMEACATPISDLEKGYIGLVSQYIAGYQNIKCYTKKGLAEGEYAVSVSMDMSFEGAASTAPGLEFFYVRTNEAGAYYIDNLYSQFNLRNRELELDSQVTAFISAYEQQEDFVKLSSEIQQKYEEALAADEALNTIANQTVPEVLKNWESGLGNGDGIVTPENPEGQVAAENPEQTGPGEAPAENPDAQSPEGPQQPEEPQVPSETVYATDNVNIRKEPREDAEKVGSAVAGQSFTRSGMTEDGWSEISYNGGTAYIKSEFLSTEAPAESSQGENNMGNADNSNNNNENSGLNYVPDGITITLNSAMNVRTSMSEDADKIGTAQIGDTVKVVLSYREGWTKVEWNGKTGYIKTDLLLNN